MRQAPGAVILTYVTIIVTTVVGLVLTPLMVRSLGVADYGVYIIAGSLVAQLTVLDFGLSNSIVRFVAMYRAKQDVEGEARFLSTIIWLYAAISILVLVIGGLLLLYHSPLARELDEQQAEDLRAMIGLLIVNVAVTLPAGAFGAICTGYERFIWPRAVQLVKYGMRTAAVIAILVLGGKGLAIVLADTLVNLAFAAVNAFYVFRKIGLRLRIFRFEPERAREIFNYSAWIFLMALIGQFQWNAGQLVLATLTAPSDVAIYAAGIQLGTFYGAFGAAITGLLLPRATAMVARGAGGEELTDQLVRLARATLLLLLLPLGGFFLFGRAFVSLWLGNDFALAYEIALLVMLSYSVPLAQGFANSVLEARGKFRAKAIAYLLLIPAGMLIGAWLVPTHGLLSLALGSCAGWLAGQLVVNIYYQQVIGFRLGRFFREIAVGVAPAFALSILIGIPIARRISASWLEFVAGCSAYLVIYVTLVFVVGLNQSERSEVRGLWRRWSAARV